MAVLPTTVDTGSSHTPSVDDSHLLRTIYFMYTITPSIGSTHRPRFDMIVIAHRDNSRRRRLHRQSTHAATMRL